MPATTAPSGASLLSAATPGPLAPVFDRPATTIGRPTAPTVSVLQAAARGDGLTVIHLLQNDEAVRADQADDEGCTPLHFAAAFGQAKVCSHLLAAGADSKRTNRFGSTPLHFAAKAEHVSAAELLMTRSLLTVANKVGDTPLHTAALHGRIEAVELFIDKGGAAVDLPRPGTGWTPLHLAAGRGHDRVVDKLLEEGAKAETRGEEGDTPFMHACAGGSVAVCQSLLAAGAKLEQTNRFGATPMHFAAGNGRDDVVTFLLGKGARADRKDCRGEWPSDWAHKAGHSKAVALLAPMLRQRRLLGVPWLGS